MRKESKFAQNVLLICQKLTIYIRLMDFGLAKHARFDAIYFAAAG